MDLDRDFVCVPEGALSCVLNKHLLATLLHRSSFVCFLPHFIGSSISSIIAFFSFFSFFFVHCILSLFFYLFELVFHVVLNFFFTFFFFSTHFLPVLFFWELNFNFAFSGVENAF